MTKEDLYNQVFMAVGNLKVVSVESLNKFFDSNVCISKGATLQCKYPDGMFYDILTLNEDYEYRIKPPEPVYEYLWYHNVDGVKYISEVYLTAEECHAECFFYLPETKRERKV